MQQHSEADIRAEVDAITMALNEGFKDISSRDFIVNFSFDTKVTPVDAESWVDPFDIGQ